MNVDSRPTQNLIIHGPARLQGLVRVDGAKNAALPIMAATLLLEEPVELIGLAALKDISIMHEVLSDLGTVTLTLPDRVRMHTPELTGYCAEYSLVKQMRASILVLGPLLARLGRAEVALPGGCAIGVRPIDQHLACLQAMGASVAIRHGVVCAEAPAGGLQGVHFTFDVVTVGGTENALMAAVLACGVTVLEGISVEPEVLALIDFLSACGAKIHWRGPQIVEVVGVASLHAPSQAFTIIGDRLEAGTFLIAAMMTQGQVRVEGVRPEQLTIVLEKMASMGARISARQHGDSIELDMPHRPRACSIETAAYPGFPTDLQAQWMALASVAEGCSVITETVWENRFMHAGELMRMGASLLIKENKVSVSGQLLLCGAPVSATDLRASAALVLAAAAAQGVTTINNIQHLDRGYAGFDDKMRALGLQLYRDSLRETEPQRV